MSAPPTRNNPTDESYRSDQAAKLPSSSVLIEFPFDFNGDGSDICESHWTAMMAKATLRGLDTDNTNSVEPL